MADSDPDVQFTPCHVSRFGEAGDHELDEAWLVTVDGRAAGSMARAGQAWLAKDADGTMLLDDAPGYEEASAELVQHAPPPPGE